jgi:hypothetical protein
MEDTTLRAILGKNPKPETTTRRTVPVYRSDELQSRLTTMSKWADENVRSSRC